MRNLLSAFRCGGLALAFVCLLATADLSAQGFNQFVAFGDSTVDSGWYRNPATPPGSTNATFEADFLIALGQGAGKATTNPGPMNTEVLSSYFGLTAIPGNQPGGSNYATGDARNSQTNTTGNLNAVPTATQIANYLAGHSGVANPNALYVISSGGNDVTIGGANASSVTTAATDLVAAGVSPSRRRCPLHRGTQPAHFVDCRPDHSRAIGNL